MEERRRQHHPRARSGKEYHSSTNHSSKREGHAGPLQGESRHTKEPGGKNITQKGGNIANVQDNDNDRAPKTQASGHMTSTTAETTTEKPTTHEVRGSDFLDRQHWSVTRTTQKPIHETAPPKGGGSTTHKERSPKEGLDNTTQMEGERRNSTSHHIEKSRNRNSQKTRKTSKTQRKTFCLLTFLSIFVFRFFHFL